MSESSGSVSRWIRELENGSPSAAQQLWNRYFHRLTLIAEKEAKCWQGKPIESEDVAASVFESLWRGAQAGRFEGVSNRGQLWWLLLALTRRKLISHLRRSRAAKRGGGKQPQSLDADDGPDIRGTLISNVPSPENAVILKEEFARLMDLLGNVQLQEVAVLQMEGYTTKEIATKLGIARATASRKLRLVRDTWEHERAIIGEQE